MQQPTQPLTTDTEGRPSSLTMEDQLRAEITRLQRENRTLGIALAEMERVAQRDMLTPLYNRRYFLTALHQRMARVEQEQDRIALVYIDVNGLKSINDRFGHGAGDVVLIEVASRLAETMRRNDVLARIGGDEFGILLDHVNYSEAKAWVRRLKLLIEDEPLLFDGESIALSAAFGMTMLTPGLSAEDLIGQADSAMYRAKRVA